MSARPHSPGGAGEDPDGEKRTVSLALHPAFERQLERRDPRLLRALPGWKLAALGVTLAEMPEPMASAIRSGHGRQRDRHLALSNDSLCSAHLRPAGLIGVTKMSVVEGEQLASWLGTHASLDVSLEERDAGSQKKTIGLTIIGKDRLEDDVEGIQPLIPSMRQKARAGANAADTASSSAAASAVATAGPPSAPAAARAKNRFGNDMGTGRGKKPDKSGAPPGAAAQG